MMLRNEKVYRLLVVKPIKIQRSREFKDQDKPKVQHLIEELLHHRKRKIKGKIPIAPLITGLSLIIISFLEPFIIQETYQK